MRAYRLRPLSTGLVVCVLCGFLACKRQPSPSETPSASAVALASQTQAAKPAEVPEPAEGSALASVTPPPTAAAAQAPAAPNYPWLAHEKSLPTDGSVVTRIAPPPGYARLAVPAGSFAEFVRNLPLAPRGTPVTAHNGKIIREGDDEYVEAVVALDVGGADLQQSPDVIIRLQAEYLWSRDDKSSISYLASSKLPLPLSRWEKGQRLLSDNGTDVFWAIKGKPSEVDYAEFRRYLDAVFNWGNSTSLAMRARKLEDPAQLLPGDFFLHARAPGHVAIVIDVAEKDGGERVALLGQALNPAQSLHLLRPGRATPWFSLRPGAKLLTPHTSAFDWSELRRLEPHRPEEPEAGSRD